VQSLKLLTALFRYKLRFSSIVDGECHIRYLRDVSCTHALTLDARCVCFRDYVYVIWIILIGKWRMNIFVCSGNREEGGFSFLCNHFVLCFCLC
jgi:hypothetical protein